MHRKYIIIVLLWVLFCFSFVNCYSFDYQESLDKNVIKDYRIQVAQLNDREKIEKYNDLIAKWIDAIDKKDYRNAVNYLEQAKKYVDNNDITNLDNALWMAYFYLWADYYEKKDYSNSMYYYKQSLDINTNEASTLFNIWLCYMNLWNYKEALKYLKDARKYSNDKDIDARIDEIFDYVESRATQKTNDEHNYQQYYLSGLNIYNARDKLPTTTYQVVIAVVDDWVNINLEDLKWKIWTNKKEIPWNEIDDDNNWYIDDYHWWNFFWKNNSITPVGDHWTMIAEIIASITNNSIWIAWIVPNVLIMPLRVSNSDWKSVNFDIIEAIDYAINNWANIINLSLWWELFEYSDSYDDVIQKAHDEWIIVIISAWNWDERYDKKIWVNTSITKLSPVCNEKDKKTIIWVGALNKSWNISKWSNYWDCVDFYAYWEEIFYPEIHEDWSYELWDWTSFSAPMIAWIIWLWYNRFWKINPEVVYAALESSATNNIIDAVKYLDNLSANFWELKTAVSWMYKQWFTKHNNPQDFKYNRALRRDEAAKFFVSYAKNILGKRPDYTKIWCDFSDLDEAWSDLRNIVIESCQLWLFNGSNGKFRPWNSLTNAQAITVFMRMLHWYQDESWSHYANKYYLDAWNSWFIWWTALGNKGNFDINATRWDVAIMLYRGWKSL